MIPKVGQVIYIPPSDDHFGGKAVVSKVYEGFSAGRSTVYIQVEQCGVSYNWEFLEAEQSELKESYKTSWASMDNPTNLSQYSFEELLEEVYRRMDLNDS